MLVVAVTEVVDVVSEDGKGSVTAPVEAVLLSLSVHTVVVTVPTVVGTDSEDDETVTLCVKVEAAGDDVAVYVGVQTSAGRVNVPLWLPELPYTTQFLLQAASPVVLDVCQQGE